MQLRLSILVLFIYFFFYYSYIIETFSFRVDYNIVYRNKSDWTLYSFFEIIVQETQQFLEIKINGLYWRNILHRNIHFLFVACTASYNFEHEKFINLPYFHHRRDNDITIPNIIYTRFFARYSHETLLWVIYFSSKRWNFDVPSPLLRIPPHPVSYRDRFYPSFLLSPTPREKRRKTRRISRVSRREEEISDAWSSGQSIRFDPKKRTTRTTPMSSTKSIYYYKFFLGDQSSNGQNSPSGKESFVAVRAREIEVGSNRKT